MTPFLQELIKGGPSFTAKVDNGDIIVAPLGDDEEALKAFQPIAERIIEQAGNGFYLHPLPHRTRDYATDYYDLLVIVLG